MTRNRTFPPIGAAAATVLALVACLLLAACGKPNTAELLASARAYQAKGDHKAAIIQLRNVLQQNPKDGEARLMLGQASLQVGDPITAEKELRRALEYGQSAELVVPFLAQAMLELGSADKLIAEFGQTKLSDPRAEASLRALQGDAQLSLGKINEAAALFATAVQADPNNLRAQLGLARLMAIGGKLDDAAQSVDAIIAKHPQAATAFALRSEIQLAKGDRAGAKNSLEQAVAADPNFSQAQFALIALLIGERQFDAATAQVAAARKAKGGDLRLVYFDAAIAYGKGDLAAAREFVSQLLKSSPDNVPTLILAGAIELKAGKPASAEGYLQKAVGLAPRHGGARRMLVRTYLGSRQPSRALDTLQPLIAASLPTDPALMMLAGETYLANGELKQASSYYAAAAQSKPQQAMARTRLGQIALASGDSVAGIKELEAVSEGDDAPVQADLSLIAGYMRRNDLDGALKAAKSFVEKRPTDPLAHQLLGTVYGARKDWRNASAAYSKALELKSNYLPAVAGLARIDLIEKRPAEARQRFQAVVDKEPKNEQALLGLAEVMARTGAPPAEVTAVLQRAVSANSQSVAARLSLIGHYLRLKDTRAALTAAQEAAAAMPTEPRILNALGQSQEAAGELNQAIETFNRLAAQEPNSTAPLLRLAGIYGRQNDYAKAIEVLRRAQKIAPAEPAVGRDLVLGYMLMAKPDDAIKEAKSFQKAAPKLALGYTLEGDVYAATKRWAPAERAYREGLKLEPNSEQAAIKLHGALVAQGKSSEADALGRKWLAENPNDMTFRAYLAQQALRAKDLKTAVALYQTIVAQQPENVSALNNLAWAAGQLGDPKALGYAERAAKLAPESAAVLDTLGTLLVAKGDAAKGLEYLAKASSLAPDRPEIRFNYAKALAKAGRKEEARAELAKLEDVKQDYPGKSEIPALMKQL